jgi:tRNA nucleotidyltransferase (CCA-adding enzyme)
LVQGKDLISFGFKESKEFKEILDFALNLQIENNMSKDEIIEKIFNKYN